MNESIMTAINETAIKGSALIQTIDPNWLYSAIAQSSAVIVGLMGAFLTTKLINQKSIIKNTESQIKENKVKIEFLKESIKDKEEWIKKVDEEENLEYVKDFLKEVRDDIDVDNPPSVDELLKIAKESENKDFHSLNKKMLEKSYNDEYLEGIRERQAKKSLPFGLGMIGMPEIIMPINPQISGMKWDRYRRYNDEISATYSEIKYLENLIKTKENELNIEKAGMDLKKTFVYLVGFSILGVFLPLFMLSLNVEVMFSFRFIILSIALLGWIGILVYLINEISLLKARETKNEKTHN